MKKLYYLISLIFCTVALGVPGEVKRNGIKVYLQPNESSPVLCSLEKKTLVSVEERSGIFWKVPKVCSGRHELGYIKMVDVFRIPIVDDKASQVIQNALAKDRDSMESTIARQRSSNAVMGVRGLDDGENDLDSAGNLTPDLKSVYSMEDRQVNENDIRKIEKGIHNELEKN